MSEGPCGMDVESCGTKGKTCDGCEHAPGAARRQPAPIPEYALQAPISERCSVPGCKGTARGKTGRCVRCDRWARRHPGRPIGPIGKRGRPPKGQVALVRMPLLVEPWAVEEARAAAAARRVPLAEVLRGWVQIAAANARAARGASAATPGKAPPVAPAGEFGPGTATAAKDGPGAP